MIVQQFIVQKNINVLHMFLKFKMCCGLIYLNNNGLSTIGLFPKWQLIINANQGFIETKRNEIRYSVIEKKEDYQTHLKQLWDDSRAQHNLTNSVTKKSFSGGLIGFVSYDYAAAQHIQIEKINQPQTIFSEYDIFFSLENNQWVLYGPDDDDLNPIYKKILACLEDEATPSLLKVRQPFQPIWSYKDYQKAFNQVQKYLRQGDCYQVNLTQPYQAIIEGHLFNSIDQLLSLTRAPYAGYLCHDDFELLSCSPELFIEFKANGEFITQPIKGTRPRHHNPEIDEALKLQLVNSEKDRSENLMIVDLLRNDFSKHARIGSVHVPALFEVHSFAQVHHMISEIRAQIAEDSHVLDILFNALPGGSITGAPKIRSMQIIEELEAQPRGAYCGSMGYLNYDNSGSFNILIRTLQRKGNTLTAWAGGGITIASRCEDEYQECQDKIGAILDCINQYEQ